ncbi:MAG: HTH domain-containing protein [Spirulinaceae cyanobacterium]
MNKITFHELAKKVLIKIDRPLTPNEIWELAVEEGLDKQLNSSGKTPWATLGAKLYVVSRDNPDSIFKTIGERPKRFYLKNKKYDLDFQEYEKGKTEEETTIAIKSYFEKDLHPFLAYFSFYSLNCYCQTINHTKSAQKSFGQWVHPDMIGCVFPINEWDNEVLELSSAIGNNSVKFISFEVKKELNLSTLREKFFQTVSNSSWANESYLAATEISQNPDFKTELGRLSSSFGIGVIKTSQVIELLYIFLLN